MSVIENVAFPLRARGGGREEALQTANELLDRLEMRDRAGARPADLSGGEAQRVALARALVSRPSLLLLDEPLSALDVGARVRVRELVRRELASFPGVRIIVTHDPVEAATLADRLVLLEGGAVTQIGSPDDIRQRPLSRYAAELVGVNAFKGRLERMEDGAGRITTGGGDVIVTWPENIDAGDVTGLLRPIDVTISLEQPSGSARNVLRGEISSVATDGDRVRLYVATVPPVVAELTRGSLERLGLREGVSVWASFKATEVRVFV
jgi:molybdopterin-binding protein